MGKTEAQPTTSRVFISSTVEDLRPFREAARDAVIAAEMLPKMLEYFAAAGDQPPLEKCLAEVSNTDLLVVILAHRYGWVPPDQPGDVHKSITWLECEQAAADGHEVLAFLVEDTHSWPDDQREENVIVAAIRDGTATAEMLATIQQNVKRLKDFKAWLSGRGIRANFTSPEDLRGNVALALQSWRQRHVATGTPARPEPAAPPADPSNYLASLRDETSHIDVRGLQVGTGHAHRFPIEDLYMTLTTTAGREARLRSAPEAEPGDRDLAEQERLALEQQREVPLHEALSDSRLVVVGDPGTGKTTFLRRVAFAMCQTRLGEDPSAAQTRLGVEDRTFPLFVPVGELAQHLLSSQGAVGAPSGTAPAWLPHFLAAQSRSEGWGLDQSFFENQLRGGSCTVLLDGLDEAPDRASREAVSTLVEKAARTFSGCRFVVTSRPAAYSGAVVLGDFAHARIEPLSERAIETFLRHWCGGLYTESSAAADRHLRELLGALAARADIRRMARNPVMLTALAVVHWNERRLPEQRADLYESIITWLSRSREQRRGRLTAERTVQLLAELALAMQNHGDGRQVQVPKRWAAEALAAEIDGTSVSRHTIQRAEQFLDAEEIDSGIIVGRGNEVRYWHLTFQEFLAARAIASRMEQEQHQILLGKPKRLYDPEWREVVLLLGGILHEQGRAKVDGLFAAVLDDLGNKATVADNARAAGLLGGMLRDLEPLHYRPADARYERLLDDVMTIFDKRRAAAVPVETRMAAADALGQAGDPRIDTRSDDYWVTIPAGKSLMGAQAEEKKKPNYDSEAEGRETPVHEVQLDEYRIARYPVTVGQYRQFVEQDGYATERWWQQGGFGKFSEPGRWGDQIEYPSRPVTDVSWHEAAAYCAWVGHRLPTEAEWERAARGTTGRKFPWGKEPADESRLNYKQKIGHVTPVGIFPLGNTPDGICDLAGNVWEWCGDWFGEYDQRTADNPQGPKSGESRVLRGGSWVDVASVCRAAIRNGVPPRLRYVYVGFRVLYSRQDSM